MAKKDGTLLLVQIGGVTLTGLIENTLNFEVDPIETTTKDSSGHKEIIMGEDGWGIDFSGLYDPTGTYGFKEIYAAALAKTALTVIYGEITSGSHYWSGSAFFVTGSLSGPKNDAAGISGTLQGTAALTHSTNTTTAA